MRDNHYTNLASDEMIIYDFVYIYLHKDSHTYPATTLSLVQWFNVLGRNLHHCHGSLTKT